VTKTVAARHQIVIGLTCEARVVCISNGNPFSRGGLVADRWIEELFVGFVLLQLNVPVIGAASHRNTRKGAKLHRSQV
jgi:hypothetical protein